MHQHPRRARKILEVGLNQVLMMEVSIQGRVQDPRAGVKATTEEMETEVVGIQDITTSFAMGAPKEGTSIGIALTSMLSAIPVERWATIRTGVTTRSLG
jgi:hypothetical protein